MPAGDPVPDSRAARVAALGTEHFDLLVIGGGVTGCGVARDAALRGMRVALVEKDDFGSGTSSRSSRLVHGGIRYLEHGHLRLVFESSAERRRLLRLAPHLVRALSFTWPVYEGSRVSVWKLEAGLTLYDVLALFRNVGRHRRLAAEGIIEREPALRREGLVGGASYFDAATDDARLTLANALGAAAAGAVVINYAEVRSLVAAGSRRRIAGATVTDRLGDQDVRVRARTVVNATGPWSDSLRRLEEAAAGAAMAHPAARSVVRGSVGVHVEVPRARVGNRGAITLLSPVDGRVMFVLPDGAHAVIGTTETPTTSSPDEVRATERDVAYLLESANGFFPSARLTQSDVVSAWAGIRPLVAAGASADLGRASREHAITRGPGGVLTITGGKLTTYRVMAADVVDEVERAAGRQPRRAPTADSPLPGGDFSSLETEVAAARAATGEDDIARRLVQAFGSAWRSVWTRANATPDGTARVVPALPYVMGEMVYAAEHELARTLGDLLIRRTRLAFETSDHGLAVAPAVAEVVGPVLGWTAETRLAEVRRLRGEIARVFEVEAERGS
ncbi:MAG: glycerol-3-phosphate dehydrogenase/oxidase [Gemmatimonadota bacterium]|nr:glycerol-3-phosphate dehydrogenase/oxidase [Gemmatimonadota bacterium]